MELNRIAEPAPGSPGKTNMRWVAGMLLVLAATLPSAEQSPPAKKSLPDWYPLKPGMKWTYDLDPGNGRIIRVTNQITGIETIDGKPLARFETIINGRVAGTQHLLSTPDGVFRYRMSGAEVSPPVCFLKYPVKEGETWTAESTIGPQQLRMSFKSGRQEDVIMASGNFKAVSVAAENNADGLQIKTSSWYARDVGMVRERREIGGQTITMDLVTFEAGK
jgi:hypothetical protein